jgi:hypothetical protein
MVRRGSTASSMSGKGNRLSTLRAGEFTGELDTKSLQIRSFSPVLKTAASLGQILKCVLPLISTRSVVALNKTLDPMHDRLYPPPSAVAEGEAMVEVDPLARMGCTNAITLQIGEIADAD